MENSSIPPKNSASPRSVARCWKTYKYAVQSVTGFICAGTMNFTRPLGLDRASVLVSREAAKTAHELDLPFDPFNLRVALKPIKRKRK
jgi:hypothetical protein